MIVAADTPTTIDGEHAGFFAELATHRNVATPLAIGVFGGPGTGKTSLLGSTLAAVARLSESATGLTTSPFLGDVATLRVEVQPGAQPAVSLVHQVFAALVPRYPRLVAEASHAGSDPRVAARDASDRLNETRQRLDAERRTLDEMSARHARVTETVLFESAGSRVDAYARANRARIDRSLRRFGFDEGAGSYRELVREASEPGGSLARGPGWLRAFWAYRGQMRLIVIALIFFALAWALGLVLADQGSWIDAIRSSNDKLGPAADWLQTHIHWLQPAREVLLIAGLVALAFNVVRGLRFLQPVVKGATLLRTDVATRRRDLDGLLAHQTQRVDGLARDVETHSQTAAEAETRLAARAADGLPARPIGLSNGALAAAEQMEVARAFFGTLASAIAAGARDRLASSASAAPSRLVIGLDGFERVSADDAARFLDAAHHLLNQPGFVTILAADRSHLAAGISETDPALVASRLGRWVQVPFSLTETDAPGNRSATLQALLRDTPQPATTERVYTARSSFDRPWLAKETDIVEAAAAFAGSSPRAIKRFVNLYRVARADPKMEGASLGDLAALATGLALQASGAPLEGSADNEPVTRAVAAALGASFDVRDGNRGFMVARRYSTGP